VTAVPQGFIMASLLGLGKFVLLRSQRKLDFSNVIEYRFQTPLRRLTLEIEKVIVMDLVLEQRTLLGCFRRLPTGMR
jgi:hypothetical protein